MTTTADTSNHRLEALLYIHQIQAIQDTNKRVRQARKFATQQGEGLAPLLKESLEYLMKTSPLQDMMGTDKEQDPVEAMARQDGAQQTSPLTVLPESLTERFNASSSTCSRPENDTSKQPALDNDKQQQELLQQTVMACYQSLLHVQQNAHLKIQQLELQILELQHLLADERARTSQLSVVNQSLRRELQAAFINAKTSDKRKFKKLVALNQRELQVEKHLNSLLAARNQAVHQNTALKRLLLQTCPDCQSQLPRKQRSQIMTTPGRTPTPGRATPGTSAFQTPTLGSSFKTPDSVQVTPAVVPRLAFASPSQTDTRQSITPTRQSITPPRPRQTSATKTPPRPSQQQTSATKTPPRPTQQRTSANKTPPRLSQQRASANKTPPRHTQQRASATKTPPRHTQQRASATKTPPSQSQQRASANKTPPRQSHNIASTEPPGSITPPPSSKQTPASSLNKSVAQPKTPPSATKRPWRRRILGSK